MGDILRSKNSGNSTFVVLQNISYASAGEYKCQVSGEGPLFDTQTQSKQLRVAVVPKRPPQITNVPAEFSIGQWVHLNCTSDPSHPPARLTWNVNGQEADDNMIRKFVSPTISPIFLSTSSVPDKDHNSITDGKGKGNRETKPKVNSNEISDIPSENQYKEKYHEHVELKSRVLALEFWLREEHFLQGRLIVKCKAEISGVYRKETASYIISKHKVQHKVLQARSNASTSRMFLSLILQRSPCQDIIPTFTNFFILIVHKILCI